MLPGDNKIKKDYNMRTHLHIPITAERSWTGLCLLHCEDTGGECGRDARGPGLLVGVLWRGTPNDELKEWKETKLMGMRKQFPC